jgi:hypothetical protein
MWMWITILFLARSRFTLFLRWVESWTRDVPSKAVDLGIYPDKLDRKKILVSKFPWLASWTRILLEDPIVAQLITKFPASNSTRKFTTMLTRTHHWSLSWASWTQATSSQLIYLRSILIWHPYLRLGRVTVAARSKPWTVFFLLDAEIVGSNPTQGMDVWCVYAFILCLCYPVFR